MTQGKSSTVQFKRLFLGHIVRFYWSDYLRHVLRNTLLVGTCAGITGFLWLRIASWKQIVLGLGLFLWLAFAMLRLRLCLAQGRLLTCMPWLVTFGVCFFGCLWLRFYSMMYTLQFAMAFALAYTCYGMLNDRFALQLHASMLGKESMMVPLAVDSVRFAGLFVLLVWLAEWAMSSGSGTDASTRYPGSTGPFGVMLEWLGRKVLSMLFILLAGGQDSRMTASSGQMGLVLTAATHFQWIMFRLRQFLLSAMASYLLNMTICLFDGLLFSPNISVDSLDAEDSQVAKTDASFEKDTKSAASFEKDTVQSEKSQTLSGRRELTLKTAGQLVALTQELEQPSNLLSFSFALDRMLCLLEAAQSGNRRTNRTATSTEAVQLARLLVEDMDMLGALLRVCMAVLLELSRALGPLPANANLSALGLATGNATGAQTAIPMPQRHLPYGQTVAVPSFLQIKASPTGSPSLQSALNNSLMLSVPAAPTSLAQLMLPTMSGGAMALLSPPPILVSPTATAPEANVSEGSSKHSLQVKSLGHRLKALAQHPGILYYGQSVREVFLVVRLLRSLLRASNQLDGIDCFRLVSKEELLALLVNMQARLVLRSCPSRYDSAFVESMGKQLLLLQKLAEKTY